MSPENIQQLTKIFLPMIQSRQAIASQTALHQLQRSQAHSGLAGSRIGQSQQLGLQAAMSNEALQQAFQQAFGLAGQRAGVWTGQQASQVQPNYHFVQGLQNAVNVGMGIAALQGPKQPKTQQFPYAPGPAWTQPGWQPQPTWGLPQEFEPRMY